MKKGSQFEDTKKGKIINEFWKKYFKHLVEKTINDFSPLNL